MGEIEESRDHIAGWQDFRLQELFHCEANFATDEMDVPPGLADFPIQAHSPTNPAKPCMQPETILVNPDVGSAPSDILEVDLAALEDPLRKLVYGTDDWVIPVQPTRVDINDPIITPDNPYPSDIDLLFSTISFFIPMKLVALLKYHMNADNADNEVERKFYCALQYIVDHGKFVGQQKALVVIGEADHSWDKTVGPTGSISIQWVGNYSSILAKRISAHSDI